MNGKICTFRFLTAYVGSLVNVCLAIIVMLKSLASFSRLSTVDVNTSLLSCMVAIFRHLNSSHSLSRAGLSKMADGCVRKKVLNRARFDRAGELEPNDSLKYF